MLPDIQDSSDTRNIPLSRVGVCDIRYPLCLPLQNGSKFNTVANISLSVNLAGDKKGTHLSRFMQALNTQADLLNLKEVHTVLEYLIDKLQSEEAYAKLEFPIFLPVMSPVSKKIGLMDYDCIFEAKLNSKSYEKLLGVKVNVTTLCPCSKEISLYGAHNQRSRVTIFARPEPNTETRLWFEELIKIAENCASCQLFPILKREDEKYVTEQAYLHPKFVEDCVRGCYEHLKDLDIIKWFSVTCESQESIHNHDAFAFVEHGERGSL